MRRGDKKPFLVMTAAILTIGLGACSTTQTVKVSEAAPITYKVGQGNSQLASVTRPTTPNLQTPAYRHETPPSRTASPRIPSTPQRTYDLSSIDRELYKHQKVGNPYTVLGKTYTPRHNPDYDQVGTASWYGDKFHGKPTANGEVYDKMAMTAAHKTLPLNSYVVVTNMETGKSLKLRLNDRGPFVGDRIIDLSEAAASALGVRAKGLGQVRVQYAGPADPNDRYKMFRPKNPEPIAPSPQQVVEDLTRESLTQPEPKAPKGYTPLRDQAQPLAGLPDAEPYAKVPNMLGTSPRPVSGTPQLSPEVALPVLPEIPKAQTPDGDEGVVTLTIKGPIHMAGHKSSENNAKWIPAVYYKETVTQK